MATETKNPRTAYAIFGTDFYGKRHHLGDAVARTAYDAWLGAQQEHGERCERFAETQRDHDEEEEDDDA